VCAESTCCRTPSCIGSSRRPRGIFCHCSGWDWAGHCRPGWAAGLGSCWPPGPGWLACWRLGHSARRLGRNLPGGGGD